MRGHRTTFEELKAFGGSTMPRNEGAPKMDDDVTEVRAIAELLLEVGRR